MARAVISVPPPGTYRVVVLGDSFAFGTGAGDLDTYPVVLQQTLEHSGKYQRVEVLNAGIPNSGPGDQVLWYDRWVSRFHPHLVVLTLYGGNDVSDEVHDSKFTLTADTGGVTLRPRVLTEDRGIENWLQQTALKIPGYDFLTQHSHLLYAVRSALTGMFNRRDQQGDAIPDSAVSAALTRIGAEIRWLRSRVERTGANLLVVFVPSRDELPGGAEDSPEVALARRLELRMRQEARADTIPFLDLTDVITPQLGPRSASLYFKRDDHMRPEGYHLIGEAIGRFLLAGG